MLDTIKIALITILATYLLLPVTAYFLAITIGEGKFDCVPQRFRNQNPTHSATYEIIAPSGKRYAHLDAPGLATLTMIQTGTVEGCTYHGQRLAERVINTPYCHFFRFMETKIRN